MASSSVGELKIGLKFDEKGLDTSLKQAESKFQKFGETAKTALVTNIVQKGFNLITGAVTDFVKSSIEVGKAFEKSMSNVAAISGATGEELEALTAKAQEMGRNTVWSASDAADAMGYMAMAGWKTQDMLDGIAGMMDLATAAGADLATTSDIVTDALTAFGLSAKDSGRLADVMAAASSNANTNVELMGETFKYAASVAGAMGYSIEDTAVAIGLMANAGIKGSQAGTSLRSIMQRLATDTSGARTEMEKLGVQVTNQDGSMRDLGSVMTDMRKAFAGLSQEEQISYAKTVAGTEAMSGLLAIVNASDEDFNKLTDAVANSNGAAAEMAAIMGDNLDGRLASLQSKVQDLQIKGFNAIEPVINAVVDALSWCADNADILLPIIGALTVAFVAWKIETLLVNAALLANPIGLIIGAVAGLIAGLVLLWNNCEGFRNFILGVVGAIGSAIGAVGEFVGGVFSKIGEIIGAVFGAIGKPIKKVADTIGKVFQKVGAVVSKVFGGIASFFNGLFDIVSGVFTSIGQFIGGIINNIVGYFEWWWNTMTSIFSAIGQFFTNVFAVPIAVIQKLIEIIAKIGEIIVAVVYGTVATAVKFFGDIFGNLWQAIQAGLTNLKNFFSSIFSAIGSFIGSIANTITNVFQTAWNVVMSGLTTVGNFFKSIFNTVWGVISGVVNNIRNAFQGAWNFMTGIFNGVGNFFRNVFTTALNNIKNVFGTIGSFFQGIWNNIVRIFTSVGSAVGNAVSGAFKSVVNGVLGFVESFVNTPIRLLNGFIDVINNAFGWVGVNIGKIGLISLPRMEHGGIVPGNDYSGDHNLIRANSGEMVITRSQQAALWEMIESGNFGYNDDDNTSGSLADGRSIEINNNYEINSTLDAEEVGDLVLESIRRAVI